MHFPLPAPVTDALSRLEARGFEAYAVGGCVRDFILGKTPHEYDLCSAATPDELRACFSTEKVVETGLKHGTLTLILDGMPLEITTFRSDGHYSDSRHPDSVNFSRSINEDLKRRDFTCNAMAYSPVRGLVDPFAGAAACHKQLLQAVGDPDQRFSEDALRILRALRFSATLGFQIEERTARAAIRLSASLDKVSRERVAKELNLTLLGNSAAEALRKYPQLLFAALPQLAPMLDTPQKTRFHMYHLWEHTLQVISHTPQDLSVRWAALLHDSGKPAAMTHDHDGTTHFRGHPQISARICEDCMASLRQPKQLSGDVRELVLYHDDRFGPDNVRRWLSKLGLSLLRRLLLLQYADIAAHSPDIALRAHKALDLIPLAEAMVDEGLCLNIRDLAVNGDMLIQAGVPKGPAIGEILSYLLDMVLSDSVANEQNALIELAQERMREVW